MKPDLKFGTRRKNNLDSAEVKFAQNQLRTAESSTPSTSGGDKSFKTHSEWVKVIPWTTPVAVCIAISWKYDFMNVVIMIWTRLVWKGVRESNCQIPLMEQFWGILPRHGTVLRYSKHLTEMCEAFGDFWWVLSVHKTNLVTHAEHPTNSDGMIGISTFSTSIFCTLKK